MKRKLLLILFVLASSLLFANEYEPEKMYTEINDNVGLYFMNMVSEGLGVTAVQLNGMVDKNRDFLITSAKSKKFKISGVKCTSMVQAQDVNGNELAYMVTIFTVKQSGLKKINKKVKNNILYFTELIDSINEKDLNSEMHGTEEAPDPKSFSTLRNLNVYDIIALTEEKEEVHLQIYIESFIDSADL